MRNGGLIKPKLSLHLRLCTRAIQNDPLIFCSSPFIIGPAHAAYSQTTNPASEMDYSAKTDYEAVESCLAGFTSAKAIAYIVNCRRGSQP